jgi:hypothetical protein
MRWSMMDTDLEGGIRALPYCILLPATEHDYFVASWWRTPLRHPPKVTRFYFQQTSGIHAPVGGKKGCSLSVRSSAPIADSSNVATMARKHSVLNLREGNKQYAHCSCFRVNLLRVSFLNFFSFFFVTQRNIILRYNYDRDFLDVGNGSAVIRPPYERRSLETSYGMPRWRPRAFHPQGCLHRVWCNRFGSLVQLYTAPIRSVTVRETMEILTEDNLAENRTKDLSGEEGQVRCPVACGE